jgi:catechol 2,3-dioxygenase-like lactoylglutathione lyase family enzyme
LDRAAAVETSHGAGSLIADGRAVTDIVGLDHVQLAMPAGQESVARAFYVDVLGLVEEQKPPNLATRGGVWFRGGALRLHLGVERDFHPAKKAHPAILVRGLAALASRCRAAGFPPVTDEALAGYDRVYVFDPFGNRIELLERHSGSASDSAAFTDTDS